MVINPDWSVVCIREIQKSLKFSAKKLIADKIEALGVGHLFDIQATEIKRIGGKGICIFQGMQDHTAESIKSLEGFMIAWVEEAQSLSEKSMSLLRPTIRSEGSELWFSWNRKKRSDAVEKLFASNRDDTICVHANYLDNPFVPKEMKKEAAECERDNPEDYEHIWLGAFESLGSKVVIPRLWLDAAIGLCDDLGIEATGKTYGATDVAGGSDGGDENAHAIRTGIELKHIEKWNGYDTSLTTQKAVNLNTQYGVQEAYYDVVGVGEGVTGEWAAMGRRGEQPKGFNMIAWNGGGSVINPEERIDRRNPNSPKNKDQYENVKAQAYFEFRKRCHNAYKARRGEHYDADMLVSIPRNIPLLSQICDELEQPQQEVSGRGKTKVNKQPDNTPSPNLADAIIMCYFPVANNGAYNISSLI